MSSARKALLAGGAVVALAIAFALLRPGDDEPAQTTAVTDASTVEPPATTVTTGTEPEDDAEPVATAPAAPSQPAATLIRVRGGKPVGGVQTIEVTKGDTIRFTVSSDQSDEVHVHGYDIERPVGPGDPARFSFAADADGIFEVELHGSDTQIASLEVQPG